VYVPLSYVTPNADYAVSLEVQSYSGSMWELGDVYAKDKTVNGFKIATNGACDRLIVRWLVVVKKGVVAVA
jgi:ribosomal protein L30E